jgi:hypothetical protein
MRDQDGTGRDRFRERAVGQRPVDDEGVKWQSLEHSLTPSHAGGAMALVTAV